jgi:hypothetical protein
MVFIQIQITRETKEKILVDMAFFLVHVGFDCDSWRSIVDFWVLILLITL